ncbi:MAG: hypothetical protein WA740_12490 [Candidatus Binataceae bacterium]
MKQILGAAMFAMILALAIAGVPGGAAAQNLPPPGAYQPIPDFSGTNAGLLFREAINDRLSGAQAISPAFVSLSFANLPAEKDGTLFYCADCQKANPCAGGGTGAWAFGQGGAWSCAGGASSLSMGGDVTGASNASTVNTVEGGKTPVVTSGINAASGTGTASALNGFNVAGVLDLTNPAYGAVCSDTTASATTTSGNRTISVNSIGDFKVGQYVKLDAAGASNTISTPTISSVGNDGYSYTPYQPQYLGVDYPIPGSTVTANGNCQIDNGTTNNANSSCTTTYCYSVQNVGQTGIGAGLNGMRSAASAAVCNSTGPSKLSVMTGLIITWSIDSNTAGTIIRRCTGASCTPSSIYAIIGINQSAVAFRGPLTSYQYRDNGFPYGIDEEGSTGAVASDLDAQITAISGTNVTLSIAPSRSTTATMRHDNSPAIQAGVNASFLFSSQAANYSQVYLPACATHYDMSQAVSFWGTAQAGITGASRAPNGAISNTQFRWDGPPGGIMFNLNYTANATIENIGVEGQAGNTPGVVIDEDRYPNSSPTTSNAGPGAPGSNATAAVTPTALRVNHVECGVVGLCVNLGGNQNDENAIFHDLNCAEPNGVGGQVCVYSDSQETYNEQFYDTNCSGRDYCFDFDLIGSFSTINTNSEGVGMLYKINGISSHGESLSGQEEGAQLFLYANYANALMTISDWRLGGGSGPWGAVIINAGAATYLGMNIEPATATTSANIALTGAGGSTFIQDNFIQPLSNYGPVIPGGVIAQTPGLIPIVNSNGSVVPSFNCLGCTVLGETVPYIVSTEPNQATAFNSNPSAQTLSGTAGTALCSQSMQGVLKTVTCYLNAYQETGTAQTFTFPTAFSTGPNLLASCGSYNPTATASVLTLPANAAMTAETCNVTAIGQ